MAGTKMARRRNVTPESAVSSEIAGTGRKLLASVMGRIRDLHDKSFNEWCRVHGYDRDKVRAALLGSSRTPEAITGALAAIRAAGLDQKSAA